MTRTQEQRCPYCGARLIPERGLASFFCQYCGGKIVVDDGDKRNIELKKMEHVETMKQLDNAHDFRTMDHIEKIQKEANSQERFRTEQKNKGGFRKGCVSIVLIIVVGFLIFAAIGAIWMSNDKKTNYVSDYDRKETQALAAHEKEVQRLTAIEKDVLDRVARGDYANALVKANTIHYNVPEVIKTWGSEEKWDERREEIIKSIYQVSGLASPTPVPTAAAFYNEGAEIKTPWPKCDIAKMIPVIASENIEISRENEKGFYLEVNGYTSNQFNKYTDACWDKGFTLNYEKGSSYFRADHLEGYHLSIGYSNNRMTVQLDKKKETND